MYKAAMFLAAVAATAVAQSRDDSTTPVPILRQINSHNDDGSYTYGFEAADGSYKIETKAANGEVKGKYGYYDDSGKLREIEYGANKNGFNPTGTGIEVPPPVISKSNIQSTNPADYDDGQYRPGPDEAGLSYTQQERQAQLAPVSRLSNSRRNFNFAQGTPGSEPVQQQQQQYYQEPQQPAYRQVQIPTQVFQGHPARNINLNSGSYSIQY